MNLSVSIEGQIKERMKSPALLSGHACRLKLRPDCAEIIAKAKISVFWTATPLVFPLVPVGDAHIRNRLALCTASYVLPLKYASKRRTATFRSSGR